jgi:hypothetical protein
LTNTYIAGDGIWYIPNTGVSLWNCLYTDNNYSGMVLDCFYQFGGIGTFISTEYSTLGGYSPYHYDDGVLVQ